MLNIPVGRTLAATDNLRRYNGNNMYNVSVFMRLHKAIKHVFTALFRHDICESHIMITNCIVLTSLFSHKLYVLYNYEPPNEPLPNVNNTAESLRVIMMTSNVRRIYAYIYYATQLKFILRSHFRAKY